MYLGAAEYRNGSKHAIVNYICVPKGIEAREVFKGKNEDCKQKILGHRVLTPQVPPS